MTMELCLDQEYFPVGDKELISTSMANALGNLKHLKNYAINLIPPSPPVLKVLNRNKTQLKHLMIPLGTSTFIEETFNFVKAAQSCLTVSSIALETAVYTDALAVGRGLVDLGTQLKHLTHPKVGYEYSSKTTLLFVDIIQNLTMLESLEFGKLDVWDTTDV